MSDIKLAIEILEQPLSNNEDDIYENELELIYSCLKHDELDEAQRLINNLDKDGPYGHLRLDISNILYKMYVYNELSDFFEN